MLLAPASGCCSLPSSLYLLCSVGDLETINGMLRGDPLPTPSLELEDQLPCSALISLVMELDLCECMLNAERRDRSSICVAMCFLCSLMGSTSITQYLHR